MFLKHMLTNASMPFVLFLSCLNLLLYLLSNSQPKLYSNSKTSRRLLCWSQWSTLYVDLLRGVRGNPNGQLIVFSRSQKLSKVSSAEQLWSSPIDISRYRSIDVNIDIRTMDNFDFRHSMYFCSLFFLMLCYFTGVHRCDRLIYYIIDVDSPNVSTNRPSPSTMHTPLVTFSPSTAAMSSSQSLQRPYHLTAFYLDDIHPIHFGFSLRVLTSSSPNYLSCYPCCYAVLCYLSIS